MRAPNLVVTGTGLNGGMAERSKAPALKAGRGASPSGVRIPLPPPMAPRRPPLSLDRHGAQLARAIYEPINDLLDRRLAGGKALIPDDLDRVIEDHLQPPVPRRELDDFSPVCVPSTALPKRNAIPMRP